MRLVRAVRAAFAITSIFLAAAGISASADTLSGRAEVIDGDTIAAPGVEPRIRLYGIDAPEGKQTCLDATAERCLCGSDPSRQIASSLKGSEAQPRMSLLAGMERR